MSILLQNMYPFDRFPLTTGQKVIENILSNATLVSETNIVLEQLNTNRKLPKLNPKTFNRNTDFSKKENDSGLHIQVMNFKKAINGTNSFRI